MERALVEGRSDSDFEILTRNDYLLCFTMPLTSHGKAQIPTLYTPLLKILCPYLSIILKP